MSFWASKAPERGPRDAKPLCKMNWDSEQARAASKEGVACGDLWKFSKKKKCGGLWKLPAAEMVPSTGRTTCRHSPTNELAEPSRADYIHARAVARVKPRVHIHAHVPARFVVMSVDGWLSSLECSCWAQPLTSTTPHCLQLLKSPFKNDNGCPKLEIWWVFALLGYGCDQFQNP